MATMTLDEFRATRAEADDLSAFFPDPALVGKKGYVYCGGRYWIDEGPGLPGDTANCCLVDGKLEVFDTLHVAEEYLHMSLVMAGADLSVPTDEQVLDAFDAAVPAPEVAAAGKADGVAGMVVVRAERSDSSPDPWPVHGAATVERIKREILEDISTLRVPADVRSFGDLGQWVDPQQYGGQLDGTGLVPSERMDFWRQAHQAVDAWLAAGRPEGGGR